MPSRTIYVNEKYQVVPEKKADYKMTIISDSEGKIISQSRVALEH